MRKEDIILCCLLSILVLLYIGCEVLYCLSTKYLHNCEYRVDIFSILCLAIILIIIMIIKAITNSSWYLYDFSKTGDRVLFFNIFLLFACPFGQLPLLVLAGKHCPWPKSLLVLSSIQNGLVILVCIFYIIIYAISWRHYASYYRYKRRQRDRARKEFRNIVRELPDGCDSLRNWTLVMEQLVMIVGRLDVSENERVVRYMARNLSWRWTRDYGREFPNYRCPGCKDELKPAEWVICKYGNREPYHLYCRSKQIDYNDDWKQYFYAINTNGVNIPHSSPDKFRQYLLREQIETLSADEIKDRSKRALGLNGHGISVAPSSVDSVRVVLDEIAHI